MKVYRLKLTECRVVNDQQKFVYSEQKLFSTIEQMTNYMTDSIKDRSIPAQNTQRIIFEYDQLDLIGNPFD